MNNKLLSTAYENGLMEVIKDWIKEQKFVSISSIQRTFSISLPLAKEIFDELIKLNIIEKEPFYNKGNKVIVYNPLVNMKVYLLDINKEIVNAFRKEFSSFEEVEVVLDDFQHFMNTHKEVQCIVSPANSFGYMSGGYDKAITDYFGKELEQEVQSFINKHLFGEQSVGTSIMVNIPNTDKMLIHTPTMRLPAPIRDPMVIYQCMRSTMMMAINNKIKSIVIPAFGGLTGRVPPEIVAKYMKAGYQQVVEHQKKAFA